MKSHNKSVIEKLLELQTRSILQQNNYTSNNVTVTDLVSPCLKQIQFKKNDKTMDRNHTHFNDVTLKPLAMPAVIGTGIHAVLEKNIKETKAVRVSGLHDMFTETYVKYPIETSISGLTEYITGIIDLIQYLSKNEYIICDYKTCEIIPTNIQWRYIEQINIYNFIWQYHLKKSGKKHKLYNGDKLYIIYISLDGDVHVEQAPIITADDVEQMIYSRYHTIRGFKDLTGKSHIDGPHLPNMVPDYICKQCPYINQCLRQTV